VLQCGFGVSAYEQAAELRELGAGRADSAERLCVLREIGLQPAIDTICLDADVPEVRLFNTGQSWPLQNSGSPVVRFAGTIPAFPANVPGVHL
jgi:salicylate hydroxylase